MQKRIMIFDSGKEWGGGTNSLIELLKRIDKDKFNFDALFYHNYRKGTESDIKSELQKLGINFLLLDRRRQTASEKVLKELARALFFFSKALRKKFIFNIEFCSRIKRDAKLISDIMQERKIDLLYMNNQPSSNLEGTIASSISGIPALQHTRIESRLNSVETALSNKWLKKIICVSQAVKDSIVSQGIDAAKCVVVHNGIDAKTTANISSRDIRTKWGIAADDVLIGTVGSLIKRKRISDFIEASAIISVRASRPVKFIVIGDGPEKNHLLADVQKNGLSDKFIFAGFQSDAISFINAMDIFVLTSETEGLPRVVLEAMLMGKPVVSSNVGGQAEVIINDETGYLLPVGKPKMFAGMIKRLLDNPGLMAKMGEKGRKRVLEEYSIERYVIGVTTVLSEVTDK